MAFKREKLQRPKAVKTLKPGVACVPLSSAVKPDLSLRSNSSMLPEQFEFENSNICHNVQVSVHTGISTGSSQGSSRAVYATHLAS